MHNIPHSIETKIKISKKMKGRISLRKGKKFLQTTGPKHWNWKGGITKNYMRRWIIKNKNYLKEYRKEYRKKNKNYFKEYQKEWREKNRKYLRMYCQRYQALKRAAGPLPIQRIQMVYEDNIKKYGTLTCYLCKKSIGFGQDCLEHKIPLSRGGTNKRDNLDIAHRKCNSEKGNKCLTNNML